MPFPRVSVVTPSLNQADFLRDTIMSVARQDYQNIEYIVIDGASSDGSVEVLRECADSIALWLSEPDHGQSNAINKGFGLATGTILAWLNADDLLAPSAATLAAHYLLTNPEVGAVYGDRLRIDHRGNVIGINRAPRYYSKMLEQNVTLPQETVFFRRDIFESVGGLDETLRFAMDFDLWCKMAKITTFRHIPAFLGCFREHFSSKSVQYQAAHGNTASPYLREHETVFRRHFGRPLPSTATRRYFHLINRLRLLGDSVVNARSPEIAHIRQLQAGHHPQEGLTS